jgi:hypothetical protein
VKDEMVKIYKDFCEEIREQVNFCSKELESIEKLIAEKQMAHRA